LSATLASSYGRSCATYAKSNSVKF